MLATKNAFFVSKRRWLQSLKPSEEGAVLVVSRMTVAALLLRVVLDSELSGPSACVTFLASISSQQYRICPSPCIGGMVSLTSSRGLQEVTWQGCKPGIGVGLLRRMAEYRPCSNAYKLLGGGLKIADACTLTDLTACDEDDVEKELNGFLDQTADRQLEGVNAANMVPASLSLWGIFPFSSPDSPISHSLSQLLHVDEDSGIVYRNTIVAWSVFFSSFRRIFTLSQSNTTASTIFRAVVIYRKLRRHKYTAPVLFLAQCGEHGSIFRRRPVSLLSQSDPLA